MNSGLPAAPAGVTVGQTKETWLEVMFYLSCFFGLLHLAGIAGQLAGMVAQSVFKTELAWQVTSSMLMGHLYLAFLAAYAGPKEFVRWTRRPDDEILSPAERKKITRGLYIVVGWAMLTGVVVLFQMWHLIAAVPETLLYTLGEVVAVFLGTEASKYLRARQAVNVKIDKSNLARFGDRVIDYVKAHGSTDRVECQNEFGLSEDQAYRLIKRLVSEKRLVEYGEARATRYKQP